MARTKISEFSSTPASNTDIDSINIAENCPPSGINDAIRELMAQLKDWQSGTSNDPYVVGSSGSLTLNQGTANGVAYLNGSKVVTSGSALTFDGTNFTLNTGYMSFGNNGYIRADSANNKLTFQAGSSGYLWKDSNNAGDWMALTSTGLGIGTSSPASKLQISSSSGGDTSGLRITRTDAGGGDWRIWSTATANGEGGGKLIFGTGSNYMTLNGSGNLGVGTTSPSEKLHLEGSGSQYMRVKTTTTNADMYFGITSSSVGYVGTGGSDPLAFYTGGTERARIDSSGNLLVGTTDSGRTTGIGIKLDIAGYATTPTVSCVGSASTNSADTYHIYSTGASAYRFYVGYGGTINATSTTITGISDQRLKENIRDLDEGLDTVMALKPRKFDWKEGKGKDIKNDRGWIAQEFETVFPDMIEEWRDPAPEGEEPYKAVNANLIPTLVKAIQEQQAIIESLKARLDAANL